MHGPLPFKLGHQDGNLVITLRQEGSELFKLIEALQQSGSGSSAACLLIIARPFV